MRAGVSERSRAVGATRPAAAQRGVTLIEILTAVTILAILTVVAAPSFDAVRNRARLRGVADNLYADLQYARSEAVQRNSMISVSFSPGATWCYGIHQGAAACDCTVANSCSIKTVLSTSAPNVTLADASFSSGGAGVARYLIDPRRGQSVDAAGAAVTGTVQFTLGSLQMNAEVNAVGRARLCSPSGTVTGYPSC